jgi:hypothetical protein
MRRSKKEVGQSADRDITRGFRLFVVRRACAFSFAGGADCIEHAFTGLAVQKLTQATAVGL